MNHTTLHQEAPQAWAERHFAEVDVGEVRRNQRVVTMAAAMAAAPEKSIPTMFLHPYDIKAAYNLFRHPEATPETLHAAHREAVGERLREPGRYLLLEDSSELSWSGKRPIPGLGPIGAGVAGVQGCHLHSVLAVRWEGTAQEGAGGPGRLAVEVVGLPAQHYHGRAGRPAGEPVNNSKVLKHRVRESQWWVDAGETRGPAPNDPQVEWTRVGERGADR